MQDLKSIKRSGKQSINAVILPQVLMNLAQSSEPGLRESSNKILASLMYVSKTAAGNLCSSKQMDLKSGTLQSG